jgi:hypothetical protein
VAYYVSLGSRGILLGIGTRLISIVGGLVYWRASRRRRLTPTRLAAVVLLPELEGAPPLP